MSITFRSNPQLSDGKMNVIVEAEKPTEDAMQLMQAIKTLQQNSTSTIVIDTNDSLEIVPFSSIVSVDVKDKLLIIRVLAAATTTGTATTTQKPGPVTRTLTTRDTLNHFLTRLPSGFVRISRQTIINIHHLRSLTLSYSGNMDAKLSGGVEETVGRRYVAKLREIIGAAS
ncbi:LytTR family DNA-binding domain-containing protein [Bifidobacterium sp. ESL0790]|uniref:LytTR family DNA-binding domain-containing protein n=1 Tax=Bifidobacterium sp. ESL0790 TaxID=2983233 RepID=UPI0023F9BCAB|nr:LytTR family DNA-binding domain-containing protein [Bifidobacterium sp. ESL0790]WEV72234.1 LytTR family DNA-binding domain-containing protein [Bifidobacterium sp. ESL0790]